MAESGHFPAFGMGCGVSEGKKQCQSLLELFDGSIARAV
jgi:hypothetical protein